MGILRWNKNDNDIQKQTNKNRTQMIYNPINQLTNYYLGTTGTTNNTQEQPTMT